jgi:hypothetical protein
MSNVGAAFLGLLYGYVALPLAYHLTAPMARRLVAIWKGRVPVSSWIAAIASLLFLLVLGIGAAGVGLDMLARGDPEARIDLGRTWAVWLFLGLIAHALVPRIETALRGQRSRGDQEGMARNETKWLIESLEDPLVAELKRRGFRQVPLTPEEARSEIRVGFPFGRLRREGPNGLEIVQIQLDKRRAPVFRITVGVAPPGGIEHPVTGHVAQDDIWAGYLRRYWQVYPAKWMPKLTPLARWFAVRRPKGAKPTKADYEELVGRAMGLLPHIERVFREGKPGPHIREVRQW